MTRLGAAARGDLRKILREELEHGGAAIRGGVEDTANDIKQMLRDQVTGAGMGQRLANTWRTTVYPRGGKPSFSAAALVYSKAPAIIRSFDEGVTIRSKDGFFIAIPTENAPKKGVGGKRISPSNFPEHRFGPLKFIYRRGGPSLLVAEGVRINKSGKVSRRLKNGGLTKTGRFKKGVTTVIMFVLVPQVRMPKRLDVQSAKRRGQARLGRNILRRWEALDAGNQ